VIPAAAPPFALGAALGFGRVLSNGAFTSLVDAGGGGFAHCAGVRLTSGGADPLGDAGGVAFWVRADASAPGRLLRGRAETSPGAVRLVGEQESFAAEIEVVVADENVELRRVAVEGPGALELTSHAGIVLHDPAAHASHPGFSKLFVQTRLDGEDVIVARRRPRGEAPPPPELAIALFGPGAAGFETDRARFLGRGRVLEAPAALEPGARLGGALGSVLDPIASWRRRAGGSRAEWLSVIATGPDAAALARRFAAPGAFAAARAAAGRREEALRARLGLDAAQAEYLNALAAALWARAAWVGRSGLDAALAYWSAHGLAFDADQLERRGEWPRPAPAAAPVATRRARPPAAPSAAAPARAPEPLLFDNGFGGFAPDGRAYVIRVPADAGGPRLPPMPWVNVIANPTFGTLVSERGAAHTWSGNSREHRLTPWSNDPIADPHGEALWIRERDALWSPQPGPTPGGADYEVRHGFGESSWTHVSHGLAQQVVTFVAHDAPVKLTRVRLENLGHEQRTLSVFSYARLVLGGLPEDPREIRVEQLGHRTLLARNARAGPFAGRVAFAAIALGGGGIGFWHCGDRRAFLGAGAGLDAPEAVVRRRELSGELGAQADPCFAQQVLVVLEPGAAATCTFVLGEGANDAQAEALIARFARRPNAFDEARAAARADWERTLGAVRIETPSPALDLMVNGWLAYQTLSCRIHGRTAFYQSGGAFGFRDQLQDAASLVHVRPDLTRAQILLHAAHQFAEGDVLHWWHPPHERGTRTRFSDDLLWLPYLTAQYVAVTGDAALLDERARFATARALAPGEDEAYLETEPTRERASVYEHCVRAIERSLAVGAHGLPLMGTGDWNDGMNRVGREGRGESVWLGFFLFDLLRRFEPLCRGRGDAARAERYAAHRAGLARAIETHAWDGAWYRRAWFDDGAPLGTAAAAECRIDALPQAWATLSGAASPERAEIALDSALRELVLPEGGLIRLLTPPFDRMPQEPGYIKGYVPGIRENGGQYTHAACWLVRAAAERGRRHQAFALLEMILPVSHARTPAEVARYQVEPYVVAADVYAVPPHVGRGGWTWYTGSSGWMLRVALESVLGLAVEDGARLVLRPCVPDAWPGYCIDYRALGGDTRYAIRVSNPSGCSARVVGVTLDGAPLAPVNGAAVVPLARDGRTHTLAVELGR
jgi:N,N'-diacetylchitobiose phosphorylase